MGLEETLEAYEQVWLQDDEDACRGYLKACFTDDGIYCDPTVEVRGPEAFAQHIVETRRAFGGFNIGRTSGFEQHHDYGRFKWSMTTLAGDPIVDGFDVVRLAEDGRFSSIVGFFGPFPER